MERCPHCARPGLFPNVTAAQDTLEQAALDARYIQAVQSATLRGCGAVAKDFETAMTKTTAVIARELLECLQLATNDDVLYATYYQLAQAGIRLPKGDKWDVMRRVADSVLFTGYEQHIRFAALTLDGQGLTNFGDSFLVLREDMIGHRASAFEENSAVFVKDHGGPACDIPLGYRSMWQERAKLCLAKLAIKLTPATGPNAYGKILLCNGATSQYDDFIEVHIWGPVSRRTLECAIVKNPKRSAQRVMLRALQQKLREVNVPLKVA
jgi:hypothetical protein